MIRRPIAKLVRQKFDYFRIRRFWLEPIVFLDDVNELASPSASVFQPFGDEVKCFGRLLSSRTSKKQASTRLVPAALMLTPCVVVQRT